MATTPLYFHPISLIVQYLTNLGVIAAGAQISTYVGGSVSTPVTTYTDATGTMANANPMVASSAGRPAGASGDPVAFWVPSGTSIHLLVQDAAGNTLVNMDNIPAVNDPSAAGGVLSSLANPAAGFGADLVANAVKSYAGVSYLRAEGVPASVSGQTLVAILEGATVVGDGLGGLYYWDGSNAGVDNGTTIINPTGNTGNGRWLRMGIPPLGAAVQLASAATTDLGAQASNVVQVTGTTTITSFGSSASLSRPLYFLQFTGNLNLTYNATSMILPGGHNFAARAGDAAIALYLGSGNWQILMYQRASGLPYGSQAFVKSIDQSLTSNTTLQNDTELVSDPMQAGGVYLVQLRLQLQGTGGTGQGWKVQPAFSGTLNGGSSGAGIQSANGTPAMVLGGPGTTFTAAAIGTATPDSLNIDFVMNIATLGTLQIQFAQNSSSANATAMKANSTMIVTRIN